ncbi:MAG: DUF177 domain-containing protein [Pseudomonadota bacterium]
MTARLSRSLSLRRLLRDGEVHVDANAEERETIAAALDLLDLDALSATVHATPYRRQGVELRGTVSADLVQPCVVSLEPVPAHVHEAFHIRLHPDAAPAGADVDPDGEDPPERLEGEVVDVGAIVLEHFVLGIPPYPRAEGAAFDSEEEAEQEPSPFAALAVLKSSRP